MISGLADWCGMLWRPRSRRPRKYRPEHDRLPGVAEIAASGRDVCRIAARWNPLRGLAPTGQLEGKAEWRAAGTLDEQALAVRVPPAPPDLAGSDDIETHKGFLADVVFQQAVQRRLEAKTQRSVRRGGLLF